MKTKTILLLSGLLTSTLAFGQSEDDTVVRVVPPNIGPNPSVASPEAVAGEPPAAQVIADPGAVEPGARPDEPGAEAQAPAVVDANPVEEEDGGFMIKDASINDIFQMLAKRANKQYFHNNKLNTDDYKVTGHLNGDTAPLKQMEELAFQYGLRMYVKGNTVYAMMDEQLQQLPAKEWTYSLRYIRPTDIEQIKALIQPMLTAGRGIVNFEPKTNTIVVIDTMHHIEMVEGLLRKIDRPKGQIVVEVKILRVNSSVGQKKGVDWANSLGDRGVSLDIVKSLNSVFGLPADWVDPESSIPGPTRTTGVEVPDTASNIILTPLQLTGVLRALNDANMVTQKSNPVVITEDNEVASVALIDRVPIITSEVRETASGTNVTDKVRYTIDESDSTDPEKTREIGVTITVRPSLLPDGTIRMDMRPRNAQIVENITGASGNVYPRVSEATIKSIARIPDGNSLIIGGFYGQVNSKGKNKVPLLGDIPILNFFFKSKQTSKEQSSLIFVVTPTSYDPSCRASNNRTTGRLRKNMSVTPRHDWVDDKNPGPAHEPNLRRTIRGMRPTEAPYYPQR
ncbi:MAG: type II secretion system protein GspD [Akkermansiaceae bacterium]